MNVQRATQRQEPRRITGAAVLRPFCLHRDLLLLASLLALLILR